MKNIVIFFQLTINDNLRQFKNHSDNKPCKMYAAPSYSTNTKTSTQEQLEQAESVPPLLSVFQPVEVDCRAAPRRPAPPSTPPRRPLLIGSGGTRRRGWRTDRGRQGPPSSTLRCRQLEEQTADQLDQNNTGLKGREPKYNDSFYLIHRTPFP